MFSMYLYLIQVQKGWFDLINTLESIIRERKSVRTYDGRALTPDDRKGMLQYLEKVDNPFRIPVDFRLLSEKDQPLGTKGVITGAKEFIGGKVKAQPLAALAFGGSGNVFWETG